MLIYFNSNRLDHCLLPQLLPYRLTSRQVECIWLLAELEPRWGEIGGYNWFGVRRAYLCDLQALVFFLDDSVPSQRGRDFQHIHREVSVRPVTAQERCLCGKELVKEETMWLFPQMCRQCSSGHAITVNEFCSHSWQCREGNGDIGKQSWPISVKIIWFFFKKPFGSVATLPRCFL